MNVRTNERTNKQTNKQGNKQTNKRTYTANKRIEKEDNNNTRHGYGNAENETHKTETVIHIQCKYFKMYTCLCCCMSVCESGHVSVYVSV